MTQTSPPPTTADTAGFEVKRRRRGPIVIVR